MPERVDFYVLNRTDEASRRGFACVVAAKAWQQGMRVYVQVDTREAERELDDLLWGFRADSFVPHARVGAPEANNSPVLIGCEPAPLDWQEMLVTLTSTLPEGANSCRRVADFIGSGERSRAAGRERFKAWRALGITPGTHDITI